MLNYYEHHIGDYDADTAHLSWLEDMAYTRLLRLYYRKEAPIPAKAADASRLVRAATREHKQAVESVLNEFFILGPDGWHQKRCDADLARFQAKAERNREVGKLGGRPRKLETQTKPPGLFVGSEIEPKANPHQTPDTRHQTPTPEDQENSVPDGTDAAGVEPPAKRRKATDPDEIIFGYGVPLLTAAGTSEKHARSFLGGLRKAHGDDALIGKLRECVKAKPLQPVEWLAAALPPPSAQSPSERSEDAIRAENARTTVEAKKRLFGTNTPETFDA